MTKKPITILSTPLLFSPDLAHIQAPLVSTADCARSEKSSSKRVIHSPRMGSVAQPMCLVADSPTLNGIPRTVLVESKGDPGVTSTSPTRTRVWFKNVNVYLHSAIHPLQQCDSKFDVTRSSSLRSYGTAGAIFLSGKPLRAAPLLPMTQMPVPSRQPKRSSSFDIDKNNHKRQNSSESMEEFAVRVTSVPPANQERDSKTSSVEASFIIEAAVALTNLGGSREN
jgi:hypothetical protein